MAVDCTIVCVHCQNKWNINTVRLHFDDFSSDLSQCDKINDILLGFGNHTHACVSTRRNNIILYFFPFIQLWFCIKWAFDVDCNAHLYILTYLSMVLLIECDQLQVFCHIDPFARRIFWRAQRNKGKRSVLNNENMFFNHRNPCKYCIDEKKQQQCECENTSIERKKNWCKHFFFVFASKHIMFIKLQANDNVQVLHCVAYAYRLLFILTMQYARAC